MTDAAMGPIIGKIQDDLVYVIEELLFDRTGEAKSELADMLRRLDAQEPALGAAGAIVREQLTTGLQQLRGGDRHSAGSRLVDLRRGLRNRVLALEGEPPTYPYGTKLGEAG